MKFDKLSYLSLVKAFKHMFKKQEEKKVSDIFAKALHKCGISDIYLHLTSENLGPMLLSLAIN